jgi:ABC-2 type transport system ATP-binding protein
VGSKRYRRSGPWALDQVDLVLAPGTTTVVVGSNGSGKSTLVRIATGITLPTKGQVTGRPGAIGYAPERLPRDLRMTARVYLAHMARIRGLQEAPARQLADELLARFDLQPGPDVAIRTLSKGNNQKVALIQAFLAPIGLLALDEPTSGLDEQARAGLWDLVERRRASGSAVLVTSHSALSDLQYDHAVALSRGRVVDVLSSATTVAGATAAVGLSGAQAAATPAAGDPATAAATTTPAVRIEVEGPGCAGVAERPGVVSAQGDGPTRVVVATREEADAVLLWALQHGCSVRSVHPDEGDR